MIVRVFGPNLRDQSKGSFHVHSESCNDNRHYGPYKKYGGDDFDGWLLEAPNRVHVCDETYPPGDFECESGEYLSDFYFFPCVKDLP